MWRKYAGAGVLVLAGLSTVSLLQAQDTDADAKPRTSMSDRFKKLRQSVGLGGGEEAPATTTETPPSAPLNPGGPPNTAARTAPPVQRLPAAGTAGVPTMPGGNLPRGSGLPNYNGAVPAAGNSTAKGPATPPVSAQYAPGAPGVAGAARTASTGVGPTPGATPPANPFRDPPGSAPRKALNNTADAGNPFASRPAEVGISDTPASAAASQYPPANRGIPAAPARATEFTAQRNEPYRSSAPTAGITPTAGTGDAPANRNGFPTETSPYAGVNARNDATYPTQGYPANRPAIGPSKPVVAGPVESSERFSVSPVDREPVRGTPLTGTPGTSTAGSPTNPANTTAGAPMASPFDERTFRGTETRTEGAPFAARPDRAVESRPETTRPIEKPETVVRPPVETARTVESGTPGRAALTPKSEPRPAPVETKHVVAPPKPAAVEPRREEPRSVVVAPTHLDPDHPVVRGTAPQDAVLLTGHSPVLVVETTGPRKIVIGKSANYSILVKNNGSVAARDVIVSIKVPEWAEVIGMEAKSRDVEKPSNTSDGVQWTLRRLKGKGEEELILKVVPRQGLPFDLSIEVSHAPVLTQASIEVQEPKLMMALTGPGEVMYGKQEIYKLTLSNPGTGDAEGVELTLLPTNAGDPTPAPHRIGGLRAGESKVIELELTARQGGTLKINAVATAAGGLKTTIDESILVRKAALIVAVQGSKFRYAGTESAYEIQVSNPGNATAQNVQLHAMLPPGAKFISASNRGRFDAENGRVVWQLSNMAPAAEQSVSWSCELTEAGLTRIQAACSADNELRNSAAFLTDVEAVADLALSVTDPRGPLPVGHEMVYEVTVENRGTKSAEAVEIIGSFSDGVEATSAAGGPTFEIKTGQITFAPIPVLEPGQSITLKVTAKASTPGNHVFRAELICDSIDTRIAKEESTRFFGDEPRVEHTAEKPGAKPGTQRR